MLPHLLIMIPYFAVIGVLVGVLSVLFGMGGGLVIVPAVSCFFVWDHFSHGLAMKVAVATSLITILTSTLNVLYKQHQGKNILWQQVRRIMPFVIFGALIGMAASHLVSGQVLRWIFICFLIGIIIKVLCSKNFKTRYELSDFQAPSRLSLGIIGSTVGILSILIGIGGNVLLMPYLRHYKMPMKNASAFTVAVMPVLALIGSVGYFLSGLHAANLPPYSLGYVNVPAFLMIQLGSFAGVSLGLKAQHYIKDTMQAKAYIGLLIIVVLLMLI